MPDRIEELADVADKVRKDAYAAVLLQEKVYMKAEKMAFGVPSEDTRGKLKEAETLLADLNRTYEAAVKQWISLSGLVREHRLAVQRAERGKGPYTTANTKDGV
jgi:hypothetical protein